MQDVEAPIVPVALDGVWGSIFSFEKQRFLWKWPRQIPYPVTVSFGPPMPPGATASEVRQVVQELLASAWSYRRGRMRPLQRAFVRSARRHPFRLAMAGSQSPKVSFGSALMKAIFLARRLKTVWAGQEKVGLLLPPSVPGALVNFAAMLLGKVPVNLNYTLSEQALASCIRQCEIKTVVTSKAFLEKVKLTVPCELVYLEERAARPRFGEKLAAFFMAWLLPVGWLERALGRAEESGAGRSGDGHFFQRQHGRAEGGHVEPLQHRLEHRADGTSLQPGRAGSFPGRAAVFPFVWFHRHACVCRRCWAWARFITPIRSMPRRSARWCATTK